MTTMPIDNHPLTQRRLQFIGISVNKLTFKSINIKQTSNNYNIVSSFICWSQNIVHMKPLETLNFKSLLQVLLLKIIRFESVLQVLFLKINRFESLLQVLFLRIIPF